MEKEIDILKERISVLLTIIVILIGALFISSKYTDSKIKKIEKELIKERQKSKKCEWELDQVDKMMCIMEE